ncbi:hypothetical protein RM697_05880 [Ichthyenterobacterium sp. W332]|uniref:Nucleic acid binding protein n=1 Tax=Microcosmobacter mediterraneus TaxID=3075607 RepID=A0ABU2YKF0_9FLAO|nr:hypothetical protein [Ichthyenterobacterium sp. W332]MDT0558164.1 hypothetical protein [Ichthyenterobacterium sp. W332]
MKKKLYIALVVLIIAAIIGYNYIYKDHRDIENEASAFMVTTKEIAEEFLENSTTAEEIYLDKVIEVLGVITESNPSDITIDNTLFCQLNSTNTLKVKDSIQLKGRVIGYDDLLEQIKLDQCYIINN